VSSDRGSLSVTGTAGAVFIALAILLFMLEAGNYIYPAHFKKEGCIAYMKIIESASEMYIMDNANKPPLSIEELVSKRLMVSVPKCPGATFRRISFLKCTDYPVISQKPYEMIPYQDAKKEFHIDVRCDIHGLLSKQDTGDKYTGAPEYAVPR